MRNRFAVHLIEVLTSDAVCLDDITRHSIHDMLVLVQYRVDDVVDRAEVQGLLQILADRIALQLARTGIRRNHQRMVALDCLGRGYAGHQGLDAAGITGKIVKFNIAERDAEISLRYGPRNRERGSVRGSPHQYAVIRVGVDAADLVIGIIARQSSALLFRLRSVASESEDHRDILIRDSRCLQFSQNRGKHVIAGKRPGDIARDDRDLLSRFYHRAEFRRADRIFQGIVNRIRAAALVLQFVGRQDSHEVLIRNIDDLDAFAITKFKFHFISPLEYLRGMAQRFDSRKLLACQEADQSAAACADITELISHFVFS